MFVSVIYTGPRESLDLSWTTEGLHFEAGKAVDVPASLVPLLKALSGHGFIFDGPADSAGPVALEPAPIPEPQSEEAAAPLVKKPSRKAKGEEE